MTPALEREQWRTIIAFLEAGNFLETAAAAAGVRIGDVRKWLAWGAEDGNPYAEFRADVLRAIAAAEAKAVEFLLIAAEAGDTKAMQWWLERRHPQKWGLKVRHVVQQEIDGVLDRVEALEGELGAAVVERVLEAVAGDVGGSFEAEIEASEELH